jgi:hypothetical protein
MVVALAVISCFEMQRQQRNAEEVMLLRVRSCRPDALCSAQLSAASRASCIDASRVQLLQLHSHIACRDAGSCTAATLHSAACIGCCCGIFFDFCQHCCNQFCLAGCGFSGTAGAELEHMQNCSP